GSDGDEDQPRVRVTEPLAVEHTAGLELGGGARGDHPAGRGRQPRHQGAPLPPGGGDPRRPLAPAVGAEEKGPRPGWIVVVEGADPPARAAARRLELHPLGAHAGEETARKISALVRHLEDAEVGETASHASTPASASVAISASARPSRSRSTVCVSSPRQGGPRRIAPPGWTSPSESRNGGRSSGQSPGSEGRGGTKYSRARGCGARSARSRAARPAAARAPPAAGPSAPPHRPPGPPP